jgi:hypothetical protein
MEEGKEISRVPLCIAGLFHVVPVKVRMSYGETI